MWTDSSGRALSDYPRPSVAVDVALLTVTWTGRAGQLAVLLHQPAGGFTAGSWGLPGTFVRQDELLADAALRALRDKVGVTGQAPQQLRVFDALDRDERGRVLSVAHLDVVPERALAPTGSSWTLAPITAGQVRVRGQRSLPYDHDRIVTEAVSWVRSAYSQHPDPRSRCWERSSRSQTCRSSTKPSPVTRWSRTPSGGASQPLCAKPVGNAAAPWGAPPRCTGTGPTAAEAGLQVLAGLDRVLGGRFAGGFVVAKRAVLPPNCSTSSGP